MLGDGISRPSHDSQANNDLDTNATEYTPGSGIHLEDHGFALDVQLQGTSFQRGLE